MENKLDSGHRQLVCKIYKCVNLLSSLRGEWGNPLFVHSKEETMFCFIIISDVNKLKSVYSLFLTSFRYLFSFTAVRLAYYFHETPKNIVIIIIDIKNNIVWVVIKKHFTGEKSTTYQV